MVFHCSQETSEKKHVYNIVVNSIKNKVMGDLHFVLDIPTAEIGSVDTDAQDQAPDIVIFKQYLLQNYYDQSAASIVFAENEIR